MLNISVNHCPGQADQDIWVSLLVYSVSQHDQELKQTCTLHKLVMQCKCVHDVNITAELCFEFILWVEFLRYSCIQEFGKHMQVLWLVLSYLLNEWAQLPKVKLPYIVLVFSHGIQRVSDNGLLLSWVFLKVVHQV